MDGRMRALGGLLVVLLACLLAGSGLQNALQDDGVRAGVGVILRVRQSHEVGGGLDVERCLAIVQQHEHVRSQRLLV